ncbi:MAG: glycosyltransferase [Conexivisphaerales archaeon]
MKIAVVNTIMGQRILGYKEMLKIADLLASYGENVDVIYYMANPQGVEEVKKYLKSANLICLNVDSKKYNYIKYVVVQMYGGIADIAMLRFLRKGGYEAVIVVSSIGGWYLGLFLKLFMRHHRPLSILVPTDPPLGISLEFYITGKHNGLRALKEDFFIIFQRFRISSFDILFGQSKWTNGILKNVFKVNPLGLAGAFDSDVFSVKEGSDKTEDKYIAVPTVALDQPRIEIVRKLHLDGIKMKIFGPIKTGIPEEEGYLDEEEMIDLIGRASAVLFLFDYEGLGLIPFESLALGTPVITEKKLGPGYELSDNPYVTFASTYDEILTACRKALNSKLTYQERLNIRQTVTDRSFQEFAKMIDATIHSHFNHVE